MIVPMGMGMGFVSISDQNIDRVLADPPLLWKFLAPDDEEVYEEARAQTAKPSFLSKLFGGKGRSATISHEITTQEGEMADADVDKAWQGLHFLFTGTAWEGEFPANFLFAGREIPESDQGYGPARVLSSAEVKEVDLFLASQSDEQILSRFNADEMMRLDIYPNIWDSGDDEVEYLAEMLSQLRDFVTHAAAHKLGMIIYLS